MATPLYKNMKNRGTTTYVFPSGVQDYNLSTMNDSFKMKFSKYILLNIPEQQVIGSGINRDQTKGKLNIDKDNNGPMFYNFQPMGNSELPVKFSEQLIESLRNYIANYDITLRESRINSTTDFYNVNELNTPTEMIFWKWAKKMNLFDLEIAEHKIDWDKNLPDFINGNGNNSSYFQKYLWKERESKNYDCLLKQNGSNKPEITIDTIAKFKQGDTIMFSGDTVISGDITGGVLYEIETIVFNTNNTILTLSGGTATATQTPTSISLNYTRFIECVGDIQAVSQIQTSKRNVTDISIQIPPHAGSTPTILFQTFENTNYYPNLEMPILPQEQQVEIIGSENTNSPIRLHPENYPGTYYGYFDTIDKTYKCSFGDKSRYSGDYFGINLTNNIGLDLDDYIENPIDFNSNNIDGMKVDFNQEHYLKMNLPEYLIRNFDEFNSAYFDKAPVDYEFNAILWYYDLDDGSGNITTNLYGLEFINNPNDDGDSCDINNKLITPYRKLVSNGEQDGTSYIFDLNLETIGDNNVNPAAYDPTSIYNQYGFELYQNILNSNAKLQESFLTIVSGYTNIQEELYDLRSMIMSDTDIKKIQKNIENLNQLLTLYSTMQMVDSDTIKIETIFDGPYPTLKLNSVSTDYGNMVNVNMTDIFKYNSSVSGSTYTIQTSNTHKTKINIWNENNNYNIDTSVLFNRELSYMQSIDVILKPKISEIETNLNLKINFNNNGVIGEKSLLTIKSPTDLLHYDSTTPINSIYSNSYYNNTNINTISNDIESGTTTKIELNKNIYDVDDIIYIDNFYLNSGSTIIDKSNSYKIIGLSGTSQIIIDLNTTNMTLKSPLNIKYYKGIKINILRIDNTNTSSISERYLITKNLI